jgi:hypothetical protein
MFRQILSVQWKWGRLAIVFLALAGFAVPMLLVRGLGDPTADRWQILAVLSAIQGWGQLFPLLAAASGLALALTAWGPDHAGRHVYALSLPVPRWHFALLRYGAGAVLLLAIVGGVLLGCLIAVASATLPPGLRAYPFAVSLRFALAAFVAYSAFFAVSAGTSRTAAYILGGLGGLVLAQIILTAVGTDVDLLGAILWRVFIWPGPLEVFTGRWMLVDV